MEWGSAAGTSHNLGITVNRRGWGDWARYDNITGQMERP
jgi:hypothetical protein